MGGRLRAIILALDERERNQPLEAVVASAGATGLLAECASLEAFRHRCDNLYQRVRALFFLHALYRYHLPAREDIPARGRIPFAGFQRLLGRRFDEAVRVFLQEQEASGPSAALASALAEAY